MTDHFLKGLVLILILGLGMTSSYVIDDPNPSDTEMDAVEDKTDQMTKLDEMSANTIDKKQAEELVSVRDVDIEELYNEMIEECWSEDENKISDKEVVEKKKALKSARRKLSHGKKSIINDVPAWLAASEICSACVLRKLCENQAVLDELGIS